MHRYILKITKWINGKLNNDKVEYESFNDALNKSKEHHGYIKIYEDEKLIHAEKKLITEIEHLKKEIIKDIENTIYDEDCYA